MDSSVFHGDWSKGRGRNESALHSQIWGCLEPLVATEAGYFIQEWGEPVARAALRSFGDLQQRHEHTKYETRRCTAYNFL